MSEDPVDKFFNRLYPEVAHMGDLYVVLENVPCDKCSTERAELLVTFGVADLPEGETEVKDEHVVGRAHARFCLACMFGFLAMSLEKGMEREGRIE